MSFDVNHILNNCDFNNKYNASTSKGVLTKWNVKVDGTEYFIKTGTKRGEYYRTTNPVAEVWCSEIAKILDFPAVEYKLGWIDGEILEADNEKVLVTVCKSFITNPVSTFLPMHRVYSIFDMLQLYGDVSYENFIEFFPEFKSTINTFILFDYLVNNPDRHLNNFGLITEMNDEKELSFNFCPLFDHGLAFYADYDEEHLPTTNTDFMYKGKAKPFLTKHNDMIKKLSPAFLQTLNLPEFSKFNNCFDMGQGIVSLYRINTAKSLFERRYAYVKSKL